MKYALTAFLLLYLCACTNRVALLPGEIPVVAKASKEDLQKGYMTAAELGKSFPLSKDQAQWKRLLSVTSRLALSTDAGKNKWTITLFEAPGVVNAATTHGNNLFVWSGLLDLADDAELAAVIAHELGHAYAGHLNADSLESASRGLVSTLAGISSEADRMSRSYYPGQANGGQSAAAVVSLATSVIALGTAKAFVEPEMQRKEYEADSTALFLMAEAGYDPLAFNRFWDKMIKSENEKGLQFALLSSHPSSKARLEALKLVMDQAIRRWRSSPARFSN